MDNKTVYIIIPIYNSEKYLRKCLDSVFSQTYKNVKIVCINDGSNDNSSMIIEEYKSYHNIIVVNQDNKGVSSARNAGLSILDYDEESYITFIDSDDWVEKNYIYNLVKYLEDNDVDIVCSSFFLANNNVNKLFINVDNDIVLDGKEATKMLLKDESIQSHSCSKLFKTKLWESVRFNHALFYMEDQGTIYKTFYLSKKVLVTNYAGYYYRQSNPYATTKKTIDNKKIISGLMGYYSSCHYKYNDEDLFELERAAQYGLAGAFLMLIPYFNKKTANTYEKQFKNEVIRYIKKKRVIKKYNPTSMSAKLKRYFYLLNPLMYPYIFRIYKRLFGK